MVFKSLKGKDLFGALKWGGFQGRAEGYRALWQRAEARQGFGHNKCMYLKEDRGAGELRSNRVKERLGKHGIGMGLAGAWGRAGNGVGKAGEAGEAGRGAMVCPLSLIRWSQFEQAGSLAYIRTLPWMPEAKERGALPWADAMIFGSGPADWELSV